jgi:RimJ/RimL family protein N-acetyltransferase
VSDTGLRRLSFFLDNVMSMELRIDGIVLRPWREDDAAAVYAACQDAEILRWCPGIPRPYTRDDAQAFVAGTIGLGPHQLAVTEEGRVVGSIGIGVDDSETGYVGYWHDSRTGHLGYWCAAEARRRGITTLALRALCRYGYDELALERLELVTDPDNLASQRVAEKVGFRREGVLRSHLPHPDGRRRDSVMFSLLPGELR